MYTIAVFLSLWTRILLPFLFPSAIAGEASAPVAPAEENFYVDQVQWSPNRPLSWNDFKAYPDEESTHHALTAANLAVSASCKQNGFSYQVNCIFLPTESWSKNKRSEKLLGHEQLHFDLTEVHARQLRKKLSQLDCGNLRTELNGTVSDAFVQWKAEQSAFDEECKHGLNAAVEREWAVRIAHRLNALQAYQ